MAVTADRIKEILNRSAIPFTEERYDSRYDLWQALEVFPDAKDRSSYPILALTIKSNNGKKNITVAFEYTDNDYVFYDLFFGSRDYEFFDLEEEFVEETIVEATAAIMKNEIAVIFAVDLKRREWLWDASFDMYGSDSQDKDEYERLVKQIKKPKGRLSKLLGRKTRYEIYNWNTYRCIIK